MSIITIPRIKGFDLAPFSAKKSGAGFTLVETIVSLGLGLLVTGMILSIFTVGLSHIRNMKNNEGLHSNAVFLLNTLTYWIKQGENLSVTPPSTLEITLPDSSVKEITKDINNDITIDGTKFNTDDVELTILNFTQMARSVQINFTLKSRLGTETLSATTTIAQRN